MAVIFSMYELEGIGLEARAQWRRNQNRNEFDFLYKTDEFTMGFQISKYKRLYRDSAPYSTTRVRYCRLTICTVDDEGNWIPYVWTCYERYHLGAYLFPAIRTLLKAVPKSVFMVKTHSL